ncbi:hypothetical protein DAEQUDRAFT_769734 [Daedalea quercina L-15889]|uniref:Uncharacterized protein n=1 Tax=Daedalea quercina L-15889 TaxID=1314783 RepID=A0A165LGC3_9APHY|nr:hypothetical protein DAEQUDRAFT_769734 [Daedalea quercina L-15889]
MTWVYGWPLYNRDAVKIAKKHNLVKDLNPGTLRLIEAAHLWVSKKAGFPLMLCCWVGEDTELVYAAYVDYRERAYPPQKILPEDPGWYRHSDGSWSPWGGELWSETDRNPKDNLNSGIWIKDILAAVADDDDEEVGSGEEDSEEGDDDESDEDTDEESTEGSDDATGSDEDSDVTVTDGVHRIFEGPQSLFWTNYASTSTSPSTIFLFDSSLTSLVEARRSMVPDEYRPANLSDEDVAIVPADVAEVMARGPSIGNGVDWQDLARTIQEHFADRLPCMQHLLHQPVVNAITQLTRMRKQLVISLVPYMHREIVEKQGWFAEFAHRCAVRFAFHLPRAEFTKHERVLHHAVAEALHELYGAYTEVWFGVEEKPAPILQRLLEKWKGQFDSLLEWLDWPMCTKAYLL